MAEGRKDVLILIMGKYQKKTGISMFLGDNWRGFVVKIYLQ